MAEEPRRSGRATKGQHTKNVEESEAPPPPKPVKPKKRTSSKKANSEPDDEDDNELIRCVCGHQEDDQGRMMICCEKCSAWQHNDCMGLPEDEASLPEKYWCEQCKPGDHKELLAAMKRGEKLWEERQRAAEETKKLKKRGRGKGARPSQGADAVKDASAENTESANGSVPASSQRKSSSDIPEDTNSRKRKTSAAASASRKMSKPTLDSLALSNTIAEISDERRRKVAEVLLQVFASQIRDLAKRGKYRIPDAHTSDSLGEQQALLVEYSMFMNLAGNPPELSGPYSHQMRTIKANIPRNPTLVLRLLNDSLTPDDLSKMSSDDMANEELQQQMATMKEESEKQSMLIQESGPRIRRTHKGEELVEDQSHVANDSVISAPPPRRRESNLEEPYSPTTDQEIKGETTAASPLRINTSGQSPNVGKARRSSSQFNIESVWTSVQSPGSETIPKRQTSGFSPAQQIPARQKDDADIDRLLNDEADSAPYTPVDYSSDSTTVWHGEVDMPIQPGTSIAKFRAFAHHVAGSDLASRVSLASIFPSKVTMDGRIDTVRADDYLTSLSAARSTDVTVFSMTPSESAGFYEFGKLFNYLVERKRFGVVGQACHVDNVRDIYIIPLEAGMGEMPMFLQRLAHNIIEQPRPRNMLLLVFVLRWEAASGQNQAGSGQAASATPGTYAGSGMSPVAGHLQSSTPSQFPANPYAGMPPAQHPLQQTSVQQNQLAAQILGPYVNCATAQALLKQQEVPASSLENLRKMFEEVPQTRDDFTLFAQLLQQA